jgi:hypothetical protein
LNVDHLDTLVGPIISGSVPPIYYHYLSTIVDDFLNHPLFVYEVYADMELYHSFYERSLTEIKHLVVDDGHATFMKTGEGEVMIIFEDCDVEHYISLVENSYMTQANTHLGTHHTYRIKNIDSMKPWEVN